MCDGKLLLWMTSAVQKSKVDGIEEGSTGRKKRKRRRTRDFECWWRVEGEALEMHVRKLLWRVESGEVVSWARGGH